MHLILLLFNKNYMILYEVFVEIILILKFTEMRQVMKLTSSTFLTFLGVSGLGYRDSISVINRLRVLSEGAYC
jgi:hypothetical protein